MSKLKMEWTSSTGNPQTSDKRIGDGSLDSTKELSQLKTISKAKKSSPKKIKKQNSHE